MISPWEGYIFPMYTRLISQGPIIWFFNRKRGAKIRVNWIPPILKEGEPKYNLSTQQKYNRVLYRSDILVFNEEKLKKRSVIIKIMITSKNYLSVSEE